MSAQQQTSSLKSVEMLPTPTAAALGKYGNIPVSYASGIPGIDIPIYTVVEGELTLPISLNYHASGIKLGEYASWVGLGWSLNAGGVITRVMKGRPDEEAAVGFLDQSSVMPTQNELSHDNQQDIDYMISVADNQTLDTEPDIFYYNFGQYSGSFYFGNDRKIYTSPFVPLQFSLTTNGFTVVTPDGSSYEFFAREITYDFKTPLYDFTSSWFLTKISSSDKKDEIFLTYKDHNLSMPTPKTTTLTYFHSLSPNLHSPPGRLNLDYAGSTSETAAIKLDEIVFKNGRLKFLSSSGRQDLLTEYRLNEIQILFRDCGSCTEEISKKFLLNYVYNSNRLFLNKVIETSSDNVQLPPHSFEYFPANNAIDYFSFSQDHWGFYNGRDNGNSLIPKTVFYPDYGLPPVELGDANRDSDEAKMNVFSLRKINYPTGGATELDYESNKIIVSQTVYSTNNVSAGTDIASGIFQKETSFTVPAAQVDAAEIDASFVSRSQLLSILTSQGLELKCASAISLQNITQRWTIPMPIESDEDGRFVSLIDLVNYPIFSGDQIKLMVDVDERCHLSTGVSINLDASITLKIKTKTGNVNVDKAVGGLRVKAIRSLNESNKIVALKSFKYEGFSQIFQPRYDYSQKYHTNNPPPHIETSPPDADICIKETFKGYILRDRSISSLGSNSAAPFSYSKVTISELDSDNPDASTNGSTIYYYENNPDIELNTDQFSITSSMSWKRNRLVKEEYYSNRISNQPLKSIEYNYRDIAMYTIRGLKISRNGFFTDSYCSTDYFLYSPFTFRDYLYFSFWTYLASKITTSNSNGNSFTEKEEYSYENPLHQQLTKTVRSTSEQSAKIYTYKYPQDYSSPNPVLTKMIAQHQIARVVESSEYNFVVDPQNLVSRTTSNYIIKNNNVLLGSIDKIRNGGGQIREVEFSKFDDDNNVVEFKTIDQIPITLFWSENEKIPLAKILNAHRDDCFYENFENGIGTLGDAASGLRFFSGATYSIPLEKRPLGNNLLMTYWYRVNGVWKLQSEIPYTFLLNHTPADAYDEIRVFPRGAQFSTYSYKPGTGVENITDANNKRTKYVYDRFNRLQSILDDNGNVIKSYSYNYFLKAR